MRGSLIAGGPKERGHQREKDMCTADKADQAVRCSRLARKGLKASVALAVMSMMISSGAAATPEDEVLAAFERFVAAQNEHDIKTVESLLLGSPDFLWVTRGTAVWGQDAAIKRFASLYQGTMATRA
jgi:hypothetical protein